jgi:putative DNA primase/helicase
MQKISETARGRWHGILPQLGISPKLLQNRHCPCPMCGGKDRFRFDDREGKGTWICNRCGSGDGAELVKRIKGVEYKEAAKMVEAVVGKIEKRPERLRAERNRPKMNEMWDHSMRVSLADPVGEYLSKRCGITSLYPKDLRYWGESTMLAKVRDGEGDPITIHQTLIKGDKAGVRMMLAGSLPPNVAIRLCPQAGPVLGIAEGIETALSASALFTVPVWAAISAPLLKKWRPPESVERVIIFGDNDENYTGQEAAYSLARVLQNDVEVEVKIPSIPGWDWNEVHRNNLDNR